MYSPAVFLHKGQKLKTSQDTVEILHALASGKLVLVDEDRIPKIENEIPKPELQLEEKTDVAQGTDVIPETVKPNRRGIKK